MTRHAETRHAETRHAAPRRAATRRRAAGFTLLELLVASVAGLFVIFAAFLVSRGATRVFATEGRLATAQGNLRLGVDRLRADLARAGYMSTPNYRLDPNVVPVPSMGFTARIQSIYYVPGTAATAGLDAPLSGAQGIYPDRIVLQGNYTTTDFYQIASIEPSASGGGSDITLQLVVGSTARLLTVGEAGSPTGALQAVFAPGRLVRVRNDLGCSQYLLVQAASVGAGGKPVITTTAAPAVAARSALSDRRCGLYGLGMGYEINPVSTVEYGVYSLASNTLFKWAYSDASVGDANKYDLVRRELDHNGLPIAGTEEIVAEYAVDLGFAFTVDLSAPQTATVQTPPNLVSYDFGDANNGVIAGDTVTGGATAVRPQRIRSVKYRLTVRSRDYDRSVPVDDGGVGLLRYKLGTNQYARARSVFGEISLANQQGVRW